MCVFFCKKLLYFVDKNKSNTMNNLNINMLKMKALIHLLSFGFLLGFIPFDLFAQLTISGRISDAEDGSPILGASVFIANSTAGTSTDADGNYRLQIPGEGSYLLTVSHVGYQSFSINIEPGKVSLMQDISLNTYEMEEVTITAKVNFRKKDIELFWKTLLGKKPSRKSIEPVNPEAVYYYYSSETQKLTVSCRVPLQIINHETGYEIMFVLNHFTHDYSSNLTYWEGQYMFTELEPVNYRQNNIWSKNRKKVYQVSISNFIRSLYQNSLLEDGFLLTYRNQYTNRSFNFSDPEIFLSDDSDSGGKMLQIPLDYDVMLVCFGKPVTHKDLLNARSQKPWEYIGSFRQKIQTPAEPVRIFSDGTYSNQLAVSPVFSSKSFSGLDMMLPIDYFSGAAAVSLTEVATKEEDKPQVSPLVDTLIRYAKRFDRQLTVFPQEKVHLHTDKPYYLSGERIWFRAHVVDAASHVPSFASGSVFVELFNAKDSVVSRVKTGSANNLYSGYINIPEDAPEGDYTIRAYTAGMRNLDEDCFFMKNIRIGDPMSRFVQAVSEFEFLSDKKIGASIHYSPISPTAGRPQGYASAPLSPESLKISINSGKPVNLKTVNGRSSLSFDLPSAETQRVMLLDATFEKTPCRQYIRIPLPDNDFDVSFYPEGGSMLYGCAGRIAFKAMQRDGTEIDIEGTVYDSDGSELGQFTTDMRGMGQFRLTPEAGKSYYAICTNAKGQAKRFELPAANPDGYALAATWGRDRLMVNVRQAESQKSGDTLCLIVHTRGVVQDVLIWEDTGAPVYFQKDFFPSGVSHLLLLTKEMVPVSERLVFVDNDEQAKVEFTTDKDTYSIKSPVEYTVNITDESGEPLQGNFSVSVTDDHVVTADTMMNILSSLLLTSDLRGNIPDPAYYFRKTGQTSIYALDMLMLTQGWRRYDTERIVSNDFVYPDTVKSKGYELSGMIRTVVGWRAVENANVSLLSLHGDFYGDACSDRNGRFFLPVGETPDSSWLIVQTNRQELELLLDEASYPERTIPIVTTGIPDRIRFAHYADKAEQQYVDEHGTRIRHIPEVVIRAKKIINEYSFFYRAHHVNYTITDKDIEKFPPASMSFLLRRIPGILVDDGVIKRGGFNGCVTILVDDMREDSEFVLERLHWHEIVQIDLVDWFYPCLSITTKTKVLTPKPTPYIKYFMPLGIQKPAEFYAQKYDTPTRNTQPDLRTTIHWAPNITSDEEGKANFSFYTADTPSTYTVTIEGVTENGKIIYSSEQVTVNKF